MKAEKIGYERQVSEAEKHIRELDAQEIGLKKQQSQLNVDQLSEATRIRHELDEIQGRRSDLKLLRDIAREQLTKWQNSAPAAGKLVKEVAAWYDETRTFVERIIENQAQVAGYLQEIETRNNKIGPAEHEYQLLTGTSMEAPARVRVYQALAFAGPGIQDIKPWTAWSFISETQRRAAYAEELEKNRKQLAERIKIAEPYVPPCATCGGARKLVSEAGAPGDGYWNAFCEACKGTYRIMIAEAKTKK